MGQDREKNLALFIDFDNVALGARDARQRFDIKLLMERILEKGKIIVKKAYADWHYYKEHMVPLHETAIELIEIPMPRISGKNSADIRLVVDAMDLCYSKDHIDTFVIVSGDSDFSPLVSKLRENNKRVIGVGVRNSSSKLLIGNCDEFIFYDDIYRDAVGQVGKSTTNVPTEKRELFDFLIKTAQGLLQESRGVLYSSLIKDTMTRKKPDFNERAYGFSTFGDLLDEARKLGLLIVERDARAGGTWVVQGLGDGLADPSLTSGGNGASKPRRSRRRSSSRKESRETTDETVATSESGPTADAEASPKSPQADASPAEPAPGPDSPEEKPRTRRSRRGGRRSNAGRSAESTPQAAADAKGTAKPTEKPTDSQTPVPSAEPKTSRAGTTQKPTKKAAAKKAVTKKAPTKKAPTTKAPTKKTTKKTSTQKAVTKKAPAKKAVTKKAVSKKTVTKKAATKKVTTSGTTAKKTTKKATKKTTKKTGGRSSK